MKQEVIQDFLNLPGIAGVALMDGRSRPYFCGVDQTLNFQQKEALAQGILQVVETIPEGFETFEFQFTGHQVHIYKLAHGIILLVLTRNELDYAAYLKTIKDLKVALQEDIANAIATFRLIAGNITLSGASYRKPTNPPAPTRPSGVITASTSISSKAYGTAPRPGESPPPSVVAPPATAKDIATSSDLVMGTTLKDALFALNHLSKFTTQYLGTHVIVNYWKATRPKHDWFDQFQVERSAQIVLPNTPAAALHEALSAEEHQWLREWVAAFIKRCAQVIRDFPAIVEQKALNEQQKGLLLG